jgi:hypothetical protein
MSKALLKIKQLDAEVFVEVDARITGQIATNEAALQVLIDAEETRAIGVTDALNVRIVNAVTHIADPNTDGIITSLAELADVVEAGDQTLITAYNTLSSEANTTFGELEDRMTASEDDRILKSRYMNAQVDTVDGWHIGNLVPVGSCVLDLVTMASDHGLDLGSGADEYELDSNRIALRVLLNGEDLVEASDENLTDGDFFQDVLYGITGVIIEEMDQDDVLVVELALVNSAKGTDSSTYEVTDLDPAAVEAVEEYVA